MSALDQSLLIATVNYHVGHTMTIRVAEEKGYFREEGLKEHVFDSRGLMPVPLEREGLALAMEERGVDIAAGASLGAALYARAAGADVFIVGGWRYDGPAGCRAPWRCRTCSGTRSSPRPAGSCQRGRT